MLWLSSRVSFYWGGGSSSSSSSLGVWGSPRQGGFCRGNVRQGGVQMLFQQDFVGLLLWAHGMCNIFHAVQELVQVVARSSVRDLLRVGDALQLLDPSLVYLPLQDASSALWQSPYTSHSVCSSAALAPPWFRPMAGSAASAQTP